MATMKELSILRQVTTARREIASAKLQAIVAEERVLRREIQEIDVQIHESFDLSLDQTMRAMGGDVLFHGWAGRRRAEIQMQIARLRVKKEKAHADLAQAFGRDEALRQLATSPDEQYR